MVWETGQKLMSMLVPRTGHNALTIIRRIDHYTTAYMNSPCYHFPDMSRVNGKNRKELLAMARVRGEGKKGISVLGDVTPKDESPFSPSRVKIEDISGEAPTGRSPSALTAEIFSKYKVEKEKIFARYEQQRKNEKTTFSKLKKTCSEKITRAEELVKKKKQGIGKLVRCLCNPAYDVDDDEPDH